MSRIAILGQAPGARQSRWALARRGNHDLTLWAHSAALADQLIETGENLPYLPGFTLQPDVQVTPDLLAAIFEADIIVSVTPSAHLRSTMEKIAPVLTRNQIIVCASKGLEEGTFLRVTQVIASVTENPCGVLSGPSFAQEVAAGQPTACVIASQSSATALAVQRDFFFRVAAALYQ